ncbi:hypothetical protein VPH35_102179 [Triticum aestivum]
MQEELADPHCYDPKYIPYIQLRRGTLDHLSMMDPPPAARDVCYISLMGMEDSSLGFACIQGSSLYTWSRKMDTAEAAEWLQYRVIELEKTIPVANPDDKCSGVGLFTIKLNSGNVKKVDESGISFTVLPYMSFYTPDRGRLLSLARTQ